MSRVSPIGRSPINIKIIYRIKHRLKRHAKYFSLTFYLSGSEQKWCFDIHNDKSKIERRFDLMFNKNKIHKT